MKVRKDPKGFFHILYSKDMFALSFEMNGSMGVVKIVKDPELIAVLIELGDLEILDWCEGLLWAYRKGVSLRPPNTEDGRFDIRHSFRWAPIFLQNGEGNAPIHLLCPDDCRIVKGPQDSRVILPAYLSGTP